MSSVTTNQETATTPTPDAGRRMSSEERREQIVAAAIAVFGARGYEGTTTDDVARTAGVSQPYVVRLFRSKENLFLAAMQSSLDQLMRVFRIGTGRRRHPIFPSPSASARRTSTC